MILLFFLPKIDVENLLFLLEHKKVGEELLDSILLVHAKSQDIRSILGRRNNDYALYLDKTENRNFFSRDDLQEKIGERLFQQLSQFTNRLIQTNKNIIEDAKKAKDGINNFLENY